jgi:threonine dehydratase
MSDHLIQKILTARVYDVAIESPVHRAPFLSSRLGREILYKREDLQPVYSFKCRGAYNKMLSIDPEVLSKGVIAASAGNHAQGVALGAQRLKIPAVIVMPTTTPAIKVRSAKARGAQVILHGDSFDDAFAKSQELIAQYGYTYLHPFDDIEVIAGQGTVAVELLRQVTKPIDAIFIPVGGGGLAAGMAAYIKYVRPEIKVIGVEPEDAACLAAALDARERVLLSQVGLFADGVAVKQIGANTFDVLKDACDEVITVTTDEICAAVKDVFDDVRSVNEPAGALSVAGLKKYATRADAGDALVAVLSGANVNFDRIRHVAERAEVGEKREAIMAVTIPERPGAFKAFCEQIGHRNITEFNYRYADSDQAHIFVGLTTDPSTDDRADLVSRLNQAGLPVVDMTDNELAKLHIRHMVGGRSPEAGSELVFRFEFPERPGALLKFLNRIGSRWNISAFHYRNHGAAYGRVLVSMQAAASEREELSSYFDDIGYTYFDESENPAVSLFMRD